MKRLRSTEHITSNLENCERTIHAWHLQASPGQTLYYYFQEDYFLADRWDEIEEIQMNIRSLKYPANVLITFKEVEKHELPDFFPDWPGSSTYWYIIAYKL